MEADIFENKKGSISCPEVWRPIFWKVRRICILSRSMEANILKKILFINLFYFVVSIGITACSIIKDVALVIETAEQYFVYFVATKLMSLASYSFHFVVHLFIIYYSVFIVFMLDVILDYILFNTLSSPSTFFHYL